MGKSKYTVTRTEDQHPFLKVPPTARNFPSPRSDMPTPCSTPPNLTRVAKIVRYHPLTIFNIQKAFVTQGLDAALHRELRDEPPIPRELDDAGGARLIQIACGKPLEDQPPLDVAVTCQSFRAPQDPVWQDNPTGTQFQKFPFETQAF